MDEIVYIPETKQNLNVLLLAILEDEEYNLLPELHGILGDKVLEFIDVFGGTEIKVPSRKRFLRKIQNVDIWTRLRLRKLNTAEELAKEFDVSVETINRRCDKIQSLVDNSERVLMKLVKDGRRKRRR